MATPLVSVLVTNYNCAPWLERCLESIAAQTYPNIEIVVADDASTDGSRAILERFAREEPRARLLLNESNIGLLRNYNKVLAAGGGQYLAMQDSDDWSEPDRIALQVEALERDPSLVYCGTAGTFHQAGSPARSTAQHRGDTRLTGPRINCGFIPPSLMVRAEIARRVGGMHEWFHGGTSMDRYFINQLALLGPGLAMDVASYHVNVRQASNHKSFSLRKVTTHALYLELARQLEAQGRDWLMDGAFAEACAFEVRSLEDPRALSEAFRQTAVFAIDFRQWRPAVQALLRSLRAEITGENLRTAAYLLRSVARRP